MGRTKQGEGPVADPAMRPYRKAVVEHLRAAIPAHAAGYSGPLLPDALLGEAAACGRASIPAYAEPREPTAAEACRRLVRMYDAGRLAELWPRR
jgi:hypothetical protein